MLHRMKWKVKLLVEYYQKNFIFQFLIVLSRYTDFLRGGLQLSRYKDFLKVIGINNVD